jgi:hypothetical protein
LRSYAIRQIVIGLVIACVGLLISLASYQTASEDGGGGYFVFWGAVVFGLLRAFRGARLYFAAGPEPVATTPSPRPSTAPGQLDIPSQTPAPTTSSDEDDLASRIQLGQIHRGGRH